MLRQKAQLSGHSDCVWCVAWSPSGDILASCGADKTVRLWRKDQGGQWRCFETLDSSHDRTIRCVAWSPSGRYLSSSGFDATTVIYARQEGQEFEPITTLEGHENEVKCAAWEAGGSLLATCSRDKNIWIWEAVEASETMTESDITDFECVTILQAHSQDVKFVKWHPTLPILVSASYDETLRVWEEDGDDWRSTAVLQGHNATVWSVAFDQHGARMVSCGDNGTLIVWRKSGDGNKWLQVCMLQGYHTRAAYSVDWAKDSELIASSGADDSIVIFGPGEAVPGELETFDVVCKAEHAHDSDVNCVAWNPKHPGLLASAGDDGLVKIWTFE